MRIPTTAREQLELARAHGHELSVDSRIREDHPEAPPKFWVACTCGYRSTAKRSVSATNSTMIWHLGKAISGIDPRAAAGARSAEPRLGCSPDDGTEGGGENSSAGRPPSSPASSRRVG